MFEHLQKEYNEKHAELEKLLSGVLDAALLKEVMEKIAELEELTAMMEEEART